jgi:hypothetical protein
MYTLPYFSVYICIALNSTPAQPLRRRPGPNRRRNRHPHHRLRPAFRLRLRLDRWSVSPRQRRGSKHLGEPVRHLGAETRVVGRRGAFLREFDYLRDCGRYDDVDCGEGAGGCCGRGTDSVGDDYDFGFV